MVQQAEGAKAKMFQVSGNPLFHSVFVDKEYAIIGAHVVENQRCKIIAHKYIDFGGLIPREKVTSKGDKQLEIVHKDGQMYFQPIAECENIGINSVAKWDQAFRIYCTVYTETHSHRTPKMLQYSHIIHHTAQLFVWDNVYAYDIDFRLHISKHPECSQGIILQQAWSM